MWLYIQLLPLLFWYWYQVCTITIVGTISKMCKSKNMMAITIIINLCTDVIIALIAFLPRKFLRTFVHFIQVLFFSFLHIPNQTYQYIHFHCFNHQRHLMVISCDKKMMMDNVPRSCQIKKKPYRCRRHQMESVAVEVEF